MIAPTPAEIWLKDLQNDTQDITVWALEYMKFKNLIDLRLSRRRGKEWDGWGTWG